MVTYNTAGVFDVTLEISDGTETNAVLQWKIILQVMHLPETILEPFAEVCIGILSLRLAGGTPTGGEYSGEGVTDGWFIPDAAGIGTHTITYTYSR